MSKLTSKRQVTIPQDICTKLGLEPGDSVRIFERDGIAHIVKMTDDDLSGSVVSDSRKLDSVTVDTVKKIKKKRAAKKFQGTK